MTPVATPAAVRTLTCGIDEAGRGALAGPVVAAACILPSRRRIPVRIADSKKMSPEKREESFAWISENCIYGIGSISASDIDKIGILAATECAMQQAVKEVAQHQRNLYLLVDGRDAFWFDYPHSSIVRGDESEECIAAASIIAKVTRDRYMVSLMEKLPVYNFASHKGYGTSEHFAAIKKNGLSMQHRKTFLRSF